MNYPNSNDLYQGKFTDGNPVAGIRPSIASANHMNALYDELTHVMKAGGVTPDVNDVSQVEQAIGNQLRSKRLFDVSGSANAILLTTPNGKHPITALNDYDELSFIVSATNTSSSVTINIDGLATVPLMGVVSDTQIFATALLTVRYIAGAFYIVDQINPKTGNNVLDIAKLYTDTLDVLNPGEYALDGAKINSVDHPIACAKAAASSNYIAQASKDADPINYGGYYGFTDEEDGSTTVSLPIVGGEFIRMFDDGRGVDSGRILGSYQSQEMQSHNHIIPMAYADDINPGGLVTATDTSSGYYETSTGSTGGGETRPRSIAYYGKTRL